MPAGSRGLAIVATLLFVGLPCEGLTGLELDDVDLDAGTLRVRRGKGAKPRELPIVPRMAAILGDYVTRDRSTLASTLTAGAWLFINARPP